MKAYIKLVCQFFGHPVVLWILT